MPCSQFRHAVRDADAADCAVPGKRAGADGRHAVGNRHIRVRAAVSQQHIVFDLEDIFNRLRRGFGGGYGRGLCGGLRRFSSGFLSGLRCRLHSGFLSGLRCGLRSGFFGDFRCGLRLGRGRGFRRKRRGGFCRRFLRNRAFFHRSRDFSRILRDGKRGLLRRGRQERDFLRAQCVFRLYGQAQPACGGGDYQDRGQYLLKHFLHSANLPCSGIRTGTIWK